MFRVSASLVRGAAPHRPWPDARLRLEAPVVVAAPCGVLRTADPYPCRCSKRTSSRRPVPFHKNEIAERSIQPPPRVRPSQRRPWPISDIIKKLLQRHEPLAEPHPDPETKARLVRSAQHPSIVPMKRVSPKRRLASVQYDVVRSNHQFRELAIFNGMDRRQRRAQLPCIDPLLRPSPLEPRLRFGHTVLDGFDTIAARERTPRADPARLQDDVRVHEHGALVPRHFTDRPDARRHASRTGPPSLRRSGRAGRRRGGARHGLR